VVEVLLWAGIVFTVGSVLVLERHCLGQMAIVQPLIVCLAAGLISGNEETSVWIGVSLQLLSTMANRRLDWAVAGVVAGASIVTAPALGLAQLPAGKLSCFVVACAMLSGLVARMVELRFARFDGERLQQSPPWTEANPVAALSSLVRRSLLRWLLLGGAEVTVGTVLSLGVVYLVGRTLGLTSPGTIVAAVSVPAIGIAVTLNTLAGYRYIAWTGIATIATWVVFI